MKLSVPLIAMFSLVSSTLATAAAAPAAPASAAPAAAASKWVEGRNYFRIVPARPTGLPAGKVQVTEVFSYACPACNQFQPYMRKLEHSVPADVVIDFVPASFNPAEDWPMFQLAYVTAQTLGIADKNHDAMFDAVWTTGELATTDPSTASGLKSHMPTIQDAARFYEKRSASRPRNSWRRRSHSASTIRCASTKKPSSNSAWTVPRLSWSTASIGSRWSPRAEPTA